MPKVNFVKAARKAYPDYGIEKGDSYYWWKRYKGPKQYSKTRPSRQQLTSSEFLIQVYDLQDMVLPEFDHLVDINTVQEFIDSLVSHLEIIRDEQEDKLNNMPESLHSSPTGELLQERYELCDYAISELEGIDTTLEEGFEEWDEYIDRVREDIQNALGEIA